MLLRRHYGISACDYLRTLEAWEAELLLGALDEQEQ